MMNNVEEYVLSYNSPSIVTFSPQIDENDSKSPSDWNPDWTIQREISITIEYRQFLLISLPDSRILPLILTLQSVDYS